MASVTYTLSINQQLSQGFNDDLASFPQIPSPALSIEFQFQGGFESNIAVENLDVNNTRSGVGGESQIQSTVKLGSLTAGNLPLWSYRGEIDGSLRLHSYDGTLDYDGLSGRSCGASEDRSQTWSTFDPSHLAVVQGAGSFTVNVRTLLLQSMSPMDALMQWLFVQRIKGTLTITIYY